MVAVENVRRFDRRGGMSMIEVMIAVVVLSFGILAMTVMQLEALRQGGAGRNTTDAAAVGRTYLEQVHRLPFADLDALKGTGWLQPAWAGARSSFDTAVASPTAGTAIENTYDVLWRITAVADTTCLLDVEMEVSWGENGRASTKSLVLATRRYDWGGASC